MFSGLFWFALSVSHVSIFRVDCCLYYFAYGFSFVTWPVSILYYSPKNLRRNGKCHWSSTVCDVCAWVWANQWIEFWKLKRKMQQEIIKFITKFCSVLIYDIVTAHICIHGHPSTSNNEHNQAQSKPTTKRWKEFNMEETILNLKGRILFSFCYNNAKSK